MSSRATAILVAVAVVAGITVAAVGLATRGSGKPVRVLQIDEVHGLVGKVVLGETRENVIGALGRPPELGYAPGVALAYPHLTAAIRNNVVVSIETQIYSLRNDKLIWAARSETTDPRSVGKLGDSVIRHVMEELRKEGLVALVCGGFDGCGHVAHSH